MLQIMQMRNKGKKSKKQRDAERFNETFKTNAMEYSYVETGQQVFDDDLDENMLDLTPDNKGKPNTQLNQLALKETFT